MSSSDVNDPRERGREEAERTAEQMRRQGSELTQQARERGGKIVEEQKHAAAGQLSAFARALHRAGDELGQDGHSSASQYAHWSAERLDNVAHNLDQQEPRALFERAERFAREQPAMFIGGAVAAGLALAWALKPPGTGISPERMGGEHEGPGEHGGHEHHEQTHGHTQTRDTVEARLAARAEAEYGELETRKPGSPPREHH
jgi:hypothetical protein